jgi:hypothetical protein
VSVSSLQFPRERRNKPIWDQVSRGAATFVLAVGVSPRVTWEKQLSRGAAAQLNDRVSGRIADGCQLAADSYLLMIGL